MQMAEQPERKVVFLLKVGADDRRSLASALFNIADQIDREEIGGKGVSGGYDSGYTWEYREGDGPSHDEYFAQLEAHLNERRERSPSQPDVFICPVCTHSYYGFSHRCVEQVMRDET